MIVVLAFIELNPGTREAFLVEFRKLVPLVRAEQGCLEYFPAIDHGTGIKAQVPLGADAVMVIEKWESVSALETHLIAPHMMDYRPKVKDYVKQVTLRILEAAG
jgi:quinol monooxygenase YgiN